MTGHGDVVGMTTDPGTTDPDIVPMPDRRLVGADVVRRLVATQFPRWAHLPVRPVAVSGWDNQTFRLGDDLSVRLPTAAEYARAVEKEHRWLPVLAPALPLPIPRPVACGRPGEGFRYAWSVYEWIDGEPAGTAGIGDPVRFATDLAGFLVALRTADPTGGPGPGLHNWFRGGPLHTYDQQTRRALADLGDRVPADLVTEIWQTALAATWSGPPVWFHGDVAAGNLLVRDGALAAVIDFGTSGVGDPACDVVAAWTMLTGTARDVFRASLGVDDATWARGRGWALWKALTLHAGDPGDDGVTRVLDEILTDHTRR